MAGVDPVEADVIMRAAQQLVSLDKPVGDDADAAQFGDLIPDEIPHPEPVRGRRGDADEPAPARRARAPPVPATAASSSCASGSRAKSEAHPRQVAKMFSLTRERTRQIEEAALRKLSTLAEAQGAARSGVKAPPRLCDASHTSTGATAVAVRDTERPWKCGGPTSAGLSGRR